MFVVANYYLRVIKEKENAKTTLRGKTKNTIRWTGMLETPMNNKYYNKFSPCRFKKIGLYSAATH